MKNHKSGNLPAVGTGIYGFQITSNWLYRMDGADSGILLSDPYSIRAFFLRRGGKTNGDKK